MLANSKREISNTLFWSEVQYVLSCQRTSLVLHDRQIKEALSFEGAALWTQRFRPVMVTEAQKKSPVKANRTLPRQSSREYLSKSTNIAEFFIFLLTQNGPEKLEA